MTVLVELAWLRSISGADAPPPSSTASSSGTGRLAVLGALVARPLSSFLAAFENDRALFLKKLEAPAIIPLLLPALPLSLPLDESAVLPPELDVVAWIWGAGGRGVVFDLGVERGVMDLEIDFGEELLLGLSGEEEEGDILISVDGSVDDCEPGIGFEGGEGEGEEDDERCLERGLNFDIVCVIYYVLL